MNTNRRGWRFSSSCSGYLRVTEADQNEDALRLQNCGTVAESEVLPVCNPIWRIHWRWPTSESVADSMTRSLLMAINFILRIHCYSVYSVFPSKER